MKKKPKVTVEIDTTDPWIKVIEMLQENWAFISTGSGSGCVVYFVSEDSDVFDEMHFGSLASAEQALHRNGFDRFREVEPAQGIIFPPEGPFVRTDDRKIYSSGEFWI